MLNAEILDHSDRVAPINTAIIRDVRCWHGGTANNYNQKRPMTSVCYYAPWFRASEKTIATPTL